MKPTVEVPIIAVEILLEGRPGAAQNAVREDYPELAKLVDEAFARKEKQNG